MRSGRFSNAMKTVLATFGVAAALVGPAVAAGTETVLYSFTGGKDGGYPDGDLAIDSAGNLYGSVVEGGDFASGAVFQLTPSGTQTVLYSFTGGADGGQPYGGVTLDSQGNLYGTAVIGGNGGVCVESGCGVVYKLTKSGGTWTQSVIYNFTGGNDGYGPGSGVTFDRHGNLYGTTPTGGAKGFGTVYQLQHQPGDTWAFKLIHTFTGGTDGGTGSAGRLFDGVGHLYGVATVGGANAKGVAYSLTPTRVGEWTLKTLYAFKGRPDAGFPYGGPIFDKAGNLYGSTYYDGANNLGSVYKFAPSRSGWTETVLHSFAGGKDGSRSISTLVFDPAGNLYGTTSEGGDPGCGCGVIFKLTPSGGTWNESVAYRFHGVPDAGYAYNGMVVDSAGNLYGTTVHGGIDNEGAIFKFKP
jgi:uncharacterized repeat protein (TIGR03803 family)